MVQCVDHTLTYPLMVVSSQTTMLQMLLDLGTFKYILAFIIFQYFLIYRITWSVKYIFHFLYRSSLSTGQADGVDPSHHDINSHFDSTKENYAFLPERDTSNLLVIS